jgi:dienelactone hydrolase
MTAHRAVNLVETSFPCADDFSMPALVMTPESPRPAPALLFIFEPFGLNPEMRRAAREFAQHG